MVTRPIMPAPMSASAAPLTPGVGRAPVRPTPGQRSALVSQGEGLAGAGCTAERHGTANAYKNHGCVCPIARQAQLRRGKLYRVEEQSGHRRRIDGTGTARRLRALAAIGWPCSHLAAELGVPLEQVQRLRSGTRSHVLRGTAAAVAALYDRLSDTPGPDVRSRTWAARNGWLPPLWWDDDTIDDPTCTPSTDGGQQDIDPIAVERAMAGDRVKLTRTERDHVIRVLAERGCSDGDIATRLHMDRATVCKHRSRHAIPSSLGRHSVRSDRDSVSNTEGVA